MKLQKFNELVKDEAMKNETDFDGYLQNAIKPSYCL